MPPDAPAVAVVNARLARHFFGNASPIGRRMRFNVGGDRPQVREIVGVVRDAKHYGVKARDWPMVFLPTDRDGSFLVRTQGDIPGIGNTIRAVVAAAGGIAQVERVRPYRDDDRRFAGSGTHDGRLVHGVRRPCDAAGGNRDVRRAGVRSVAPHGGDWASVWPSARNAVTCSGWFCGRQRTWLPRAWPPAWLGPSRQRA